MRLALSAPLTHVDVECDRLEALTMQRAFYFCRKLLLDEKAEEGLLILGKTNAVR
jgi:hypothetical protein